MTGFLDLLVIIPAVLGLFWLIKTGVIEIGGEERPNNIRTGTGADRMGKPHSDSRPRGFFRLFSGDDTDRG